MTIIPDTKDWTFVLRRPCPECGFDARSVRRDDVAGRLRETVGTWRRLLTDPGRDVRGRPAPHVWSTLEYGCHVRDVYGLFDRRLRLMLDHDDPRFENWDQDATAVEQRYGEQDPNVVAAELVAAGDTLADRFGGLRGDQWRRTGRRSDGAEFTVESFARYLLHDLVHHVWDVDRPARD